MDNGNGNGNDTANDGTGLDSNVVNSLVESSQLRGRTEGRTRDEEYERYEGDEGYEGNKRGKESKIDEEVNDRLDKNSKNSNSKINNDFVIPEEYRNKGWAKNIKSQEDLFKTLDNAQALIGKKTIGIPDFDKASDEELQDFYAKLTPKDAKDYGLEEMESIDEATKENFATLFRENGINKRAGQNILKAYQEMLERAKGNDESLNAELQTRLGEDYETRVDEIAPMFKKYLSNEDRAIMLNMPDKVKGILCSFADRIRQEYGISLKSNIARSNDDGGGFTLADYDREMLELYNLDSQHKLSLAQKQQRLDRLEVMRKSIKKWS